MLHLPNHRHMIVGTIEEVVTGSQAITTALRINLVGLTSIVQDLRLRVDPVIILTLVMMIYVGQGQEIRDSLIARETGRETVETVTVIETETGIVIEVVIDEIIVLL